MFKKDWMFRYLQASPDADAGGGGDEGGDAGAGDAGDVSKEGANAWPETWRETYAGEDEGKLAKLSRYASPTAAFDAMIAAQNKISSGEFKQVTPFPMKGTPEEQTAWRSDNGIPEAPDKYDLGDFEIDEEDKPVIDGLLKSAHEANMSPDNVKATVDWYYQAEEAKAEARQEADKEFQSASEDTLRAEWGNEYRANVNRITGLLDTAPEGVKDNILNARLPNGSPLASDPDSLKFLIDLALQINPATTLVPGAGDNIVGAIGDEITTLESMMGNRSSEYWKGPKADANQARLRDLYEARDKMK